MIAPVVPLHSRLRTIEPGRAELQTQLIRALNQRLVEGLTISAQLASERDRRAATAWILFRAGGKALQIAPLLVENALARLSGSDGDPDAAAAAATLARIEPLIALLELAIGRELQPVGLQATVDEEHLLLRLDASASDGAPRHRIIVGLPGGLIVEPLPLPPLTPGAMAKLRLRWTAFVAGPTVGLTRLEQLAKGDLLVVGTGPLVARLTLPGRNGRPRARVDLQQGVLVLDQDPASDDNAVASLDREEGAAIVTTALGELRVATTIELTGSTLTASELATLAQGSVLPLAAQGGTLRVRVLAGAELVARGELVAVGQGFGVLITAPEGERAD